MKKQLISIGLFIVLVVGLFFTWDTVVIYPLKLLVVFFHEASHALMTLATGGQVLEMSISPQEGGHVLSFGGNNFLVGTAGYLGSLLWGSIIYLGATKTKLDKYIMAFLGMMILSIALIYVKNPFGFSFSIATGLVMIFIGFKVPEKVNDLILRVIGLTSMFYAPLDIWSDTIARSEIQSDARNLAERYFGTTIMWGGLWIVISVVVIYFTLKYSFPKGDE